MKKLSLYVFIFTVFLYVPIINSAINTENGASLYLDHGCYSCHGYNGSGRHPIANNMSGIMSSEALFITFLRLRADLNPLKPSNSMPNYSEAVINDEQAQDLYAYINTLTDNPPQIENIPILKNILDNAIRKTKNE